MVDVLAERQAEDIVLLDISNVCDFADYFVIATGNNVRQLQSLQNYLRTELTEDGSVKPFQQEGTPDSGWILVDYGDIIVHLFSPAQRGYYDLESLWRGGTEVVRIQ
ncbi:MAG: ribosome silencing factor [Dehalococcoidia bacterium]